MYRYQKAFAAIVLAAASAATASARADDGSAFDCSRRVDGSTTPCDAPRGDRLDARLATQARHEVARVERAVEADSTHLKIRPTRHAAPARPVTNDAVLADGVTIDGG